jgi:molybdenum cofactor cytidylyltransferase
VKFGNFPIDQCLGAVLAHTLKLPALTIKKGAVLDADQLNNIASAGVSELIVARLDEDDIIEDIAAKLIAEALQMRCVRFSEAGTGRVNFFAETNGVFTVSKKIVDAINAIDPGITIATLAENEVVKAGRMVATVKIIPYAVSLKHLDMVIDEASSGTAMTVCTFIPKRISVISTKLTNLKDKTIEKTIAVLEQRLAISGSKIVVHQIVPHEIAAVRSAIKEHSKHSDMVVLFGASAISDQADVIPAALVGAGGTILRFGMPVDPGNLLMIGELEGRPVIGAPGCARSSAENGFDFVLNRLLAGIQVTGEDIAAMGVGGLLMEITSRPQPRQVADNSEFKVAALILAAGQSRRMGKDNKLTMLVQGKPMVRYPVEAAKAAGIKDILIVTGHQEQEVRSVIGKADVQYITNDQYADGLSTSLIAGIGQIPDSASHALVMLGDMPKISAAMVSKMLENAENADPATIVMATHDGKRGNPVLWPRLYFDALEKVAGDTGARHIIGQNMDHVVEVELGPAASLDIDTPEAFEAFVSRL